MEARKVTIYSKSPFGFGYRAHEGRAYECEVKPYAQYPAAVFVSFVPKGARKARRIDPAYSYGGDCGPRVLVLDGWGHPAPGSMFKPSTTVPGASESRMMSCDPGWDVEFNAMIEAYIAESGARVLHDYRKPYSERTAA